jgi:hypothetical protein
MANLFFTGFAGIDNSTRGELIDVSGGITASGRFGQGMQGNDFMKSFVTADGTIIVGMAVRTAFNPSSDRVLMAFAEGTTQHVQLSLGAGGVMKVWRGPQSAQLGSNIPTVMPVDGTWHYVEMKAYIHDSAGTVDVQFDGVNVFSISGQDTQNGGTGICDRFYHDVGNFLGTFLDDFYINDGTGSAPHNTFYGDVRCDAVATVAEGSTVDFTPSTGTDNEANIDDGNSPDGDTTYNESATVGHRDLFTLGGFSTSGAILGVRTRARTRKTDAGARNMRTVVKSGSATSLGTPKAQSTSYSETSQLDTVDPNTGVAWTAAGINAAEVGYEIAP